jgi:simple sugar transport system ATP-binding protein
MRRGLVMAFSAEENGLLGSQDDPRWGRGLLLDRGAMRRAAEAAFAAFGIRPSDPTLPASAFSGGNQQKIVVAREVARVPRVLVVGQPTRGLDIGAIDAIRRRIVDLRDEGVAVLLVSSDLDEIRALADRVLVMCRGRIVGECRSTVDDATIGAMMAGVAVASSPEGAR